MKNELVSLLSTILLLSSCSESTTIGKYRKEPLPQNFAYKIIEDRSNEVLEKNELTVEINKKISVEQIATLADEFYSSKPKQRRFYVFYLLPGMEIGAGAWATSHFDPDLEISILGSSTPQDDLSATLADQVDGNVIGKWHEEQYTSSTYVIYSKSNKLFMRTVFKNGQVSDKEVKKRKVKIGSRYDYKEGGYNGEYFILNVKGELEFYNSEDKNFTTASKVK